MKLQNKRTGEIKDLLWVINHLENGKDTFTLAELNAEWEDVEEPKGYWYMSNRGDIRFIDDEDTDWDNIRKQIGNYFDTREEAEKAVEKLKAWKRLKDKGFRFNTWYGGSKNIDWEMTSLENEAYIPRQICDDLDLLFSGGEE